LPRSSVQFLGFALAALAATGAWSQNTESPGAASASVEPAVVSSVRVVHERGAPALEVVSSHPVVPTIRALDSPPRLVIDLSNARMGLARKRIPVLQENILTIRAEQYQIVPPITRIVLDLLVPYAYTWDAAGNRLMVRLKPAQSANQDAHAASKESPFQPPQVLSLTPDATPAVVPVTGGVGEVVMAGRRFAAGSSLSAGSETAVLHLSRGGEVRVCPGTTVSVTPSRNARDLMMGMSAGGIETHYALAASASADTVLTPDFRIQFAGPGEFDYAVSTDAHGNTCVRALPGNTSSAIVSELLGDRVYRVKPTEQAVFHLGRIDKVDADVPAECGCPQPVPVMRTDASPASVTPDSALPANVTLAHGEAGSGTKPGNNEASKNAAPQTLSSGPEIRPLPPSRPDEVHIQVEAPFVFRGKPRPEPPPVPTNEAAALTVMQSSDRAARVEAQLETQAEPPPAPDAPAKAEHHGILRRIGRLFTAIFG